MIDIREKIKLKEFFIACWIVMIALTSFVIWELYMLSVWSDPFTVSVTGNNNLFFFQIAFVILNLAIIFGGLYSFRDYYLVKKTG